MLMQRDYPVLRKDTRIAEHIRRRVLLVGNRQSDGDQAVGHVWVQQTRGSRAWFLVVPEILATEERGQYLKFCVERGYRTEWVRRELDELQEYLGRMNLL